MKILIVEDDNDLSYQYSFKLKQAGHQTSIALNGRDAMTKIRQHPDLIILDIMIPEINGLEILRWMRRKKMDIPVLVNSVVSKDAIKVKNSYYNIVEILDKYTMTPHDLVKIIDGIK